MARVSLRDVASKAGVSFQTAGKVLNGKGSVSAATRERILHAARDLNYVPNAVARGLVTRKTFTIGIVASDLGDPELARFVVGAEREARRRGHAVLIGNVDREGTDAERYLGMLLERRVDGILTAAPQMEHDERVGDLLRGPTPAVSIHRVAGRGISLVGSDHRRTGLLATERLLGLGHRRIATVTGSEDRQVTAHRLEGYKRALAAADVPFDPALVACGDWDADGTYEATCRLLDRTDATAFFAQNDVMAFGVLSALRDRGLAVPDDRAVIGCDDIPLAAHAAPPLSTVHVPFYETGKTAVRLLLDTIAGEVKEPRRVLLPVRLVVRESCGASMVRDETPAGKG